MQLKKKLAVIGSRTFVDKNRLREVLTKNYEKISMIISGGARGPDTYAVEWAIDFGVPYLVFPALFHNPFTGEYNKSAGFRRNRHIIEQADVVIAFWDEVSRGTAHALDIAKQLNKPIKIISFKKKTE